jgi:hypothetical protein
MSVFDDVKSLITNKKNESLDEEQNLKSSYEVIFEDKIMNDIKNKIINDEYVDDVGNQKKITLKAADYYLEQCDKDYDKDTHFWILYSVIREYSLKHDLGGEFYISLQPQEIHGLSFDRFIVFKFTL